MAAATATAMAGAQLQPAFLQQPQNRIPSLLSSRVALSPSQLNLAKQSCERNGGSNASRSLSIVAMAKKARKAGARCRRRDLQVVAIPEALKSLRMLMRPGKLFSAFISYRRSALNPLP